MNYQKIKETCPLAFEKLLEWRDWLEIKPTGELGHYFTDGVHTVQQWINLKQRDLFDFFDSHELYIRINPKYYDISNIECWVFWFNDGDPEDYPYDKPPVYGINYSGQTRTDCEKDAFKKAFELLEQKLKRQNEKLDSKI